MVVLTQTQLKLYNYWRKNFAIY